MLQQPTSCPMTEKVLPSNCSKKALKTIRGLKTDSMLSTPSLQNKYPLQICFKVFRKTSVFSLSKASKYRLKVVLNVNIIVSREHANQSRFAELLRAKKENFIIWLSF
ncbi:15347_t:CDS:2, partial [Funneliformis caledonium]